MTTRAGTGARHEAAGRAGAGVDGADGGHRRPGDGGGPRGDTGEDVTTLVIERLTNRFPGLQIWHADIDRAHRLPGAHHRVIVRFVQSGRGSVRDQLMWRRRELRAEDELFINESLTKTKGNIQRCLLAAKRAKQIHAVYTRWGQVFFRPEQYGAGVRVDSMEKLRQLGFREYE